MAAGASLSVRPASLLLKIMVDSGTTLVVVTFDETSRDELTDYRFHDDVTAVLPALAERLYSSTLPGTRLR